MAMVAPTSHGGRGSAGFEAYNREQRSVGVDLAAPRGWEDVHEAGGRQ